MPLVPVSDRLVLANGCAGVGPRATFLSPDERVVVRAVADDFLVPEVMAALLVVRLVMAAVVRLAAPDDLALRDAFACRLEPAVDFADTTPSFARALTVDFEAYFFLALALPRAFADLRALFLALSFFAFSASGAVDLAE